LKINDIAKEYPSSAFRKKLDIATAMEENVRILEI